MPHMGREYWRRRNAYAAHRIPRWSDIPEDDPPAYDRFGMMMKIDGLDRAWRDLVNEYGFSWVLKAMQGGHDPKSAARWLAGIRERRQWSNPNGEIEVSLIS